jgi:hypothetical protein
MPVGADLMRAKTCYQQPLTYLESVCCRVKVYQDQGPVLSFPRILSTQAQPGRIRRSGGPWPNHQTQLVSELDRRRAYLTAWRNRIPAGRTKLNHGGRQHQRRKSALAGSHPGLKCCARPRGTGFPRCNPGGARRSQYTGRGSNGTNRVRQVMYNPAPIIAPNSVLHIFSPATGGSLALGTAIQIYGSNLASSTPVLRRAAGYLSLGDVGAHWRYRRAAV